MKNILPGNSLGFEDCLKTAKLRAELRRRLPPTGDNSAQ